MTQPPEPTVREEMLRGVYRFVCAAKALAGVRDGSRATGQVREVAWRVGFKGSITRHRRSRMREVVRSIVQRTRQPLGRVALALVVAVCTQPAGVVAEQAEPLSCVPAARDDGAPWI